MFTTSAINIYFSNKYITKNPFKLYIYIYIVPINFIKKLNIFDPIKSKGWKILIVKLISLIYNKNYILE